MCRLLTVELYVQINKCEVFCLLISFSYAPQRPLGLFLVLLCCFVTGCDVLYCNPLKPASLVTHPISHGEMN